LKEIRDQRKITVALAPLNSGVRGGGRKGVYTIGNWWGWSRVGRRGGGDFYRVKGGEDKKGKRRGTKNIPQGGKRRPSRLTKTLPVGGGGKNNWF